MQTDFAITQRELRESLQVLSHIEDSRVLQIISIARFLEGTFRLGGKVVLFGNGGSAAVAQHIAAELVGRFQWERPALPALALTTDSSILTSVANDDDFEQIFARQVEALVVRRDLVVGLSTSGSSMNVVKGLEAAKVRGAHTVGFTGRHGGLMAQVADLLFHAPSENTARIQEAHLVVWHILCHLVEGVLRK